MNQNGAAAEITLRCNWQGQHSRALLTMAPERLLFFSDTQIRSISKTEILTSRNVPTHLIVRTILYCTMAMANSSSPFSPSQLLPGWHYSFPQCS